MTEPNHIAEARKKVSRPQIREVFLRNGAVIPADRDDLPDYVYESVLELLEMAAPAVQGEPEIVERLASAERRCSEAISEAYKLRRLWGFAASMIAFNSKKITPRGSDEKRLIELAKGADHGMAWSGRTDGWITESMACSIAVTHPAEQQPCPEGVREGAPYDDPAFESLCREYGIWGTAAAAQCAVFWGAGKRVAEQQPAPDASGLVEALEAVVFYHEEVEDNDGNLMMHYSKMLRMVRAALAAHRKGGSRP